MNILIKQKLRKIFSNNLFLKKKKKGDKMLDVIILAIIQGIAEFLPISSSAHLIIFRDLFGIGKDVITSDMAISFDVALHLGTLLVIVIYYFKDFWNMVVKGLTKGPKHKEGKLLWQVAVATIPAAIMGALFEDVIDEFLRTKFIVIALALIIIGIVIYLIDKKEKEVKSIKDLTYKDALIIGCSQIFALIPGCSRSGATISAARLLKLKREESLKFSFFLSLPIILGAVCLTFIKDGFGFIANEPMLFTVGVLVSFVVGLLTIKFLFKFIKKNDFKAFMIYRIIIGIIVIIFYLVK